MHKDIHCAVIINCWTTKLGEITFENRPSKFPAFVEDVRRICGTKEFVEVLYNYPQKVCFFSKLFHG
jgi:hypothetical protein